MTLNTSLQLGKKIVHVVQRMAPGGLENLTLDLLTHAHPLDQVIIISLEGVKPLALSEWPRLEPYAKQLIFLNKAPGVQLSVLVKLVKTFSLIKPDVVHTHHIGPLLYGSIAAAAAKVPVRIHTEHDVWHLQNRKRVRIQNLALKIAKPTLVADAARVKTMLDSCFNYPKTVTIKNGIDCRKFHPNNQYQAREACNLPQQATIIGSAGRLEKVKGHDVLITALRFLPPHVVVAIAGDGSQKVELQSLAHRLGVSNRVIFLGLVENMPRFYQALDLFCLPSRCEGFPLSPLEAQACNIPTAVTQVGAAEETLCPTSGKLISANNPINMAVTLLKMLECPAIFTPRDFVLKHNEVGQMAKAYQDLSKGVTA